MLQANVTLHTLDELNQLLLQAEQFVNTAQKPIPVVLHGEEIHAFVRSNYRTHKGLVDLAARLDAFNVIEVKACERWMGVNGISAKELPPFIETVPAGLAERDRLQRSGYTYF